MNSTRESTVSRLGRGVVLLLVTIWLVLAWQEAPPGLLGKSTAIAYAVCHRLPSHSPFFGGVQFPLCFRCSGMYLGALSTWVWLMLSAPRRGGLPRGGTAVLVAVFFAAFALDGLNALAHDALGVALYTPQNTLRLFTGLGMGLTIAALLYPIANQTFWRTFDQAPALHGRNVGGALLGLVVMGGLMLLRPPVLLYPLALLSTGMVFVLLTLIYTLFVVGFARRENTAQTWRDLRWPLLVGATIAMTQLALLDIGRFTLTGTWVGVLP